MRDIADNLGFVLRLVVLGGIEGELADQLALLGDDPHVEVRDQHQDP
ncbi:MAG: hypothetical protein JO248_00680 [Acidimicrobiia bacterium]|nr:hypothetical protein [Acidimicrobiia bacterium]